ncbi:AEC family transporter [Bifidobacterium tsurumiense]|uniref:Malate permease n=1 Tax=Bifidobacterium tsurumiense TaxID=356829 RepID=A0A087EK21_9BIFI|nr:AEC family transporter [Bifidobacterium tsurumiense]KFJ08122.1 malate permease [Bifidobacterium tsurumiense]
MIFLTSLENILPIILIIALGYFLQVRGWFSDQFSGNISKLIMNVGLPASIFVSVLKYLNRSMLVGLSSGLLYVFGAFVISYVFAFIMIAILRVPAGRRGVFVNMVVNANTIFIGLPLNIALFGNEALPYFLIYYIANTVSTWTVGVYLITADSKEGKKAGAKFDWKKLLPPPLVGFLIALMFLFLDIPVPTFAINTLTYIGNIVTPMSLLYIGIVLARAGFKSIRVDKDTIGALAGRYIVAPLVMLAILSIAGGNLPANEFKTFIVQSAAPALAVLPILADQGDGDREYATNLVTISTVLFVVVIPVVLTLLG